MKGKWYNIFAPLSLLALIAFLASWLTTSYQREKENLTTELEFHIGKVKEEVKDSMLIGMFELLVDSVRVEKIQQSKQVLGVRKSTNKTIEKHIWQNDHQDKGINITVSGDRRDSIKTELVFINNLDTIPDTLKRNVSFKIMTASGDSLSFSSLSNINPEEIHVVESKLLERIHLNHLPDEFEIFRDSASIDMSQGIIIMLNDEDSKDGVPTVATFHSYNSYLLRKLIPQILVSILLLSVVSITFYLLFRTIREQEKYSKLKNDFISNMTHELKTPISTVSVAVEAFQNFDVLNNREKTNEYLHITKMELNRLKLLVNKVLKMSQFESNVNPLGKITRTDLKEIIENVSSSMQLQFEKYDATLQIDIKSGAYTIEGDQVHLTNIIYNLIDNALKYGGEHPEVILQMMEEVGSILIKVKDNGLGIAKEFQDKVFERFFRVPAYGDTHNVKGYGLGLNYVSEIVKAHGGTIRLQSEINKGSEFIIELPKHV